MKFFKEDLAFFDSSLVPFHLDSSPPLVCGGLPSAGPRAALVIATATGHRLAKTPARCRERCQHTASFITIATTAAEASATVVASSFRRYGYACALAAKASVLSIFAFSRSHSAALRFTSFVFASDHPCPRNGETTQELIGTLPPDPLPPL